jgi:hypothetical protein
MSLLGYGEDALTLWLVSERLQFLLEQLGEEMVGPAPKVLYKPSFGRAGGQDSAQFGEFDFLIIGNDALYLGESKWDNLRDGPALFAELAPEQLLRHRIFRAYVTAWYQCSGAVWADFCPTCLQVFEAMDIVKPVAPDGSLLAQNLMTVLAFINQRFEEIPQIEDVFVYFYRAGLSYPPEFAPNGFGLVTADYSEATDDNFIELDIGVM